MERISSEGPRLNVFPTAPVCGFFRDVQSAASDYLLIHTQVPELLAAHRADTEEARIDLNLGYRWLCYLGARDPKWPEDNEQGFGWRNWLLGTLGQLMVEAVVNLRGKNPKAKKAGTIPAEDVDQYLRDCLSRARNIYSREITRNLLVPRSTKSTRKDKNQKEHIAMKHKEMHTKDGRLAEPLRILTMPEPQHYPQLAVDETPLETAVWSLVRLGKSERDIAEAVNESRTVVRQIIAALMSRVRLSA